MLVVGDRMHRAEAIPWLRRRVNRWMSRQISRLAGRHLPDSQCGFRLINVQSFMALGLKTDHFEIESEMLLAFVHAGYRVEFRLEHHPRPGYGLSLLPGWPGVDALARSS